MPARKPLLNEVGFGDVSEGSSDMPSLKLKVRSWHQKTAILVILVGAVVSFSPMSARCQSRFSDLGGRESQAAAIEEMATKGIIAPQSPDKFTPSGVFTRADFAVAVQKLFNLSPPSRAIYFADVRKGSPHYEAIEAAAPFMDKRAICPTCLLSSNFAPDAALSRVYGVVSLVRIQIEKQKIALVDPSEVSSALVGFPDTDRLSPQARQLIATAIRSGVITQPSGRAFEPARSYDRGDIAVVLYNSEKLLNRRP
jgi:N-acetylmuramoyl-L-alanine amidase